MPSHKDTGHSRTSPAHSLAGVHKRAAPYSARREPHAHPQHEEIGLCQLAGAHRLALFIHRAVRLIILRVADLTAALPVKGASWRAGVDG